MDRAIVLTAPCGSGKELVVARHAVRWALNGCRVVWLTARAYSGELNKRKELEAVMKTNRLELKVAVMRSKPNVCRYAVDYMEKTGRAVSGVEVYDLCRLARESGSCKYVREFEEFTWTGVVDEGNTPPGACPYYWLKRACSLADIVVCDYNYAIDPLSRRGFAEVARDAVLFFDECHTLQRRCEAVYRLRLSARTVEAAVKELEGEWAGEDRERFLKLVPEREGATRRLKAFGKALERLMEGKLAEMRDEAERGSGELKARITYAELNTPDFREALNLLESAGTGAKILQFKFSRGLGVKSATMSVQRFLSAVNKLGDRSWICYCIQAKEDDGKLIPTVGASLIYPALILKKALKTCSTPLFYSGTLYADAFVNLFGFRGDGLPKAEVVSGFKPPFPKRCWLDIFTTPGFRVTRETLKDPAKAERLADIVEKWFCAAWKAGKRGIAVMTMAQSKAIGELLRAKGHEVRIVEWTPLNERKAYITDWLEGPLVEMRVMSPYSWPAVSMDFKEVDAVLMIGVPIPRMTVEHRAEVDYLAGRLAEKRLENPYAAAKTWLETVQAMQYQIQANSRARPSKRKTVASVWLDERFVEPDTKLTGYFKTMTGRGKPIIETDPEKAMAKAFSAA
jgi:Rad3-related DNA helicase